MSPAHTKTIQCLPSALFWSVFRRARSRCVLFVFDVLLFMFKLRFASQRFMCMFESFWFILVWYGLIRFGLGHLVWFRSVSEISLWVCRSMFM